MQDPDLESPVNPLPPLVVLVFLALAGVEAGLSLGEAVEWCGEPVTVREATRLRRLAGEDRSEPDGGVADDRDVAGSGGAGGGTSAG